MIHQEQRINPSHVHRVSRSHASLDHTVKDLLSFFNGFQYLHEAKRVIEKQCDIKKEPGHKCWSEDYIKQAWEETTKEKKKSRRRRHWARVIMLQVIKSFVCDTCKQNAAQKTRDATTVEQGCETTPNSEDASSQSIAELETAGPSRGEQTLGEGKKLSKEPKLSASITDDAPSPAEVNPVTSSSNSETRNAGLLNEDEDTDNDNDQRKDVDDYELYVEGMYDPENEILEDDLCSTDDMNQAESFEEYSEDRSTQDSDVLNTEDAETDTQHSGRKRSNSTNFKQTEQTKIGKGTHFPSGRQDIASEVVTSQSGADSAAPNYENIMDIVDEYNYICIPLSKFASKSTTESSSDVNTNTDTNADTHLDYTYQLIDQSPSNTQRNIYTKESYVMLYDTDTKNAKWVYELLNKSTVPYPYKKQTFKKDETIDDDKQALESKNGFEDKDYVRGHLAAAANHTWCQEAYKDTYLISNMTPQISSINNGIWKTLENYCRSLIENDEVRNVHVYTGPLYQNNDEGSTMKGKAVPTHYFKVVIIENENGKAKVECYMVENKKQESETTDNPPNKRKPIYLLDYKSDMNTIETMSEVKFTKQSDNNRVIKKKTLTCTGENGSKRATIVVNIST